MIQFSGTSIIQSKYVRGSDIRRVVEKHGGKYFMGGGELLGLPFVVITNRLKNKNALQIDRDLHELAEKAAANHGVELNEVYYHTERSNLSESWKKSLVRRLTLDTEA